MIARNPLVRRLGMAAVLLGATILTAACEAPPMEPTSAPPDPVVATQATLSGPAAGHPVVILRGGSGAVHESAPVTDDFGEAMELVAPGGRVLVHPGTYPTNGRSLFKPVTIQGTGDDEPVLDGNGACWALEVSHVPDGLVHVRGVRILAGFCGGLAVSNEYEEVLVEETTFGGTGAGITIGGGAVDGRTVTIRQSDFVGDGPSIMANVGAGHVIAEDNRMSGRHMNISFDGGVHGRIEGNLMTGCGPGGLACIAVGGFVFNPGDEGAVEVVGNTVEVELAEQLPSGMLIGGGDHRIVDNVIRGIGRDPSAPTTHDQFPLTLAGIEVVDGATAEVSGNRVENAFIGLQFGHPVAANGLNNVVTNVDTGIQAFPDSKIEIHSSDITDYQVALAAGGPAAVQDFTCNWWGSEDGPTDAGDPSLYTPWATEPVAGTSTTTCDGGL